MTYYTIDRYGSPLKLKAITVEFHIETSMSFALFVLLNP